jgi:hypothetical protein
MTKDDIIKTLRDMAKYPTVTLPRDCDALRDAADLLAQPEQEYQRGYADAMGWKVQNHLEHLPPAQPEQELVATVTSETGNPDVTMSWWHEPALPIGAKLYTTPPQRTWVGLTPKEVAEIVIYPMNKTADLVRIIEAKLKEKNEY